MEFEPPVNSHNVENVFVTTFSSDGISTVQLEDLLVILFQVLQNDLHGI